MQGRRLPEVPRRREQFLHWCRHSADAPMPRHLCSSVDLPFQLEQDRQNAYSRLLAEGIVMTDMYLHQPFSLAYIDTTEDLEREADVYDNLPPERRHRICDKLFSGEGFEPF